MIAVDVMGGDHAPQVVLEGALKASQQIPVALFGPQNLIEFELNKLDVNWRIKNFITIYNCTEQIGMDDEPVAAVCQKKDSSLVQAVKAIKTGKCSVVISAGNSGALMAASFLILGKQEGIDRPAIAGFLPTANGKILALDLGANTDCRPEHLFSFASLGAQYLKQAFNISNPRIGLLANGEEDCKGSKLTKEAFNLLKKSNLNFIGNIEPYDVFKHKKVDVVVCDGFTGNILLKTTEAVAKMLLQALEPQIDVSLHRNAFCNQGGAILLGVNGKVVVCHGAANTKNIQDAIIFASHISKQNHLSFPLENIYSKNSAFLS